MGYYQYTFLIIAFLITKSLFSQEYNVISKKQFIVLGESHYYSGNNEIEIKVIDSVLHSSKFKSIYIGIEFPVMLEYFINTNDSNIIKKYFEFNTDRYYKKNTLTKPSQHFYELVLMLLEIKKKYSGKYTEIKIKCFDNIYVYKSLYFTLSYIISRNKQSVLYKKYNKSLDEILKKQEYYRKDSMLFARIKEYFIKNIKIVKNELSENDFNYFRKIVNSTIGKMSNDGKRDKFIFKNISGYYGKSTQVICIIGSAHIIGEDKNNLRMSLNKKFNNLFSKKTYYIDIVPKKYEFFENVKGIDKVIINEGRYIFE